MEEIWKDIKGFEGLFQVCREINMVSLKPLRQFRKKFKNRERQKVGILECNYLIKIFIKKVPSKTVDFSHQIQKEKFQN